MTLINECLLLGFCIAYNFKNLGTDLTDLLLPVRYKAEPLNMDDSFFGGKNANNSFLIDALTRKKPEWDYEKEWRLLFHSTSDNPIKKVQSPKPIHIIIGKDMLVHDRDKLKKIADYIDVPCIQQRFNRISGDFEFIPITN